MTSGRLQRKTKRPGTGRLLLAAAVAAALLISPRTGQGTVVMTAPPFEGRDLAGGSHSLSRLMNEGKTTVVFFWALRCAPCLREMAALDDIYKARNPDGLEVLAVETAGNSPRLIEEILDKLSNVMIMPKYPIIPDPDFSLSRKFSVQVAPRTFLINKLGEIVYSFDGFSVELKDALSAGIDALLAGREFSTDAPVPPEIEPAALPATALAESADKAASEESDWSGPGEAFDKNRYYGDFYFHKKEYDKAIASYVKCIALEPDNIYVRLKIGEAYAKKKMLVQARESWEHVLRVNPGNAEADAFLRRLLRNEY